MGQNAELLLKSNNVRFPSCHTSGRYATINVVRDASGGGLSAPILQVLEPNESEVGEVLDFEIASYFQGLVGDAIRALPDNYRNMSESELIAQLSPTPLDYAIRRAFWDSFNKYKSIGKKKIPAARIYEDTCNRTYFEASFMKNPLRVAWMSRPIVTHVAYYEAINKIAVQKLLEYVAENKVSEKNLLAILKLAEASANRAYGAVVQKIQTKNLNLEGRIAEPIPVPAADQGQLEARAQELQAKLLSQAKDVTPTDAD